MRFILWLVLAVLIGIQAEAQSVRVVVLSHPEWPQGYVSPGIVESAAAQAVEWHRALGLPALRIKDIRYKRDPAPHLTRLEDYAARLSAVRASRLHNTMRRGVDYVYYIVSPLVFSGGQYGLGGLASQVCAPPRQRNSLAMGQMRDRNEAGQDRFLMSAVIMAHEIGHLVGASHVQTETLMNFGALSYLPDRLGLFFDPANISQVARCKRRMF